MGRGELRSEIGGNEVTSSMELGCPGHVMRVHLSDYFGI
jgi:hypothetical protein